MLITNYRKKVSTRVYTYTVVKFIEQQIRTVNQWREILKWGETLDEMVWSGFTKSRFEHCTTYSWCIRGRVVLQLDKAIALAKKQVRKDCARETIRLFEIVQQGNAI